MGATSIEWTDFSVNPLRARLRGLDADLQPIVNVGHYCEKVSPGCKNCYSSRLQPRFGMPQFQEQRGNAGIEHWLDVSKLEDVLRRRKPTKFFWCDMTDMFGDWVPNETIATCFAVMAATPQHTHQVLTKRLKRAAEWFKWVQNQQGGEGTLHARVTCYLSAVRPERAEALARFRDALRPPWPEGGKWPLSNVWLGASVENQKAADERIPLLRALPAAVRFISAEPLLGPLDLSWMLQASSTHHLCMSVAGAIKNGSFDGLEHEGTALTRAEAEAELRRLLAAGVKVVPAGSDCDNFSDQTGCGGHPNPRIDWVIAGSESGQRARPMDEQWVRSLRDQCTDAGVSFFYKQKLEGRKKVGLPLLDGRQWAEFPEARV